VAAVLLVVGGACVTVIKDHKVQSVA